LELARSQALSIYGVNLDAEINAFYEATITPWEKNKSCTGNSRTMTYDTAICDISEMFSVLYGRSKSSEVSCSLLFICGKNVINTDTHITTEGVFVADQASFTNPELGKSENGADGTTPGAHGGNGSPGASAPNLSLRAQYKLPRSADTIFFTSKGASPPDPRMLAMTRPGPRL